MTDKNDLYTLTPSQVVLYGVGWCNDCRRARAYLDGHHIPYLDVDVDRDPQAEAFVKELNNGYRSVPTIIFPDGSVLVEPSTEELAAKFQ